MNIDFLNHYINSCVNEVINGKSVDLDYLFEQKNFNRQFEIYFQEKIIIKLIKKSNFKEAKDLILKWNLVNYVDVTDKSMLMYAIESFDDEFINILLDNEATVTSAELSYCTEHPVAEKPLLRIISTFYNANKDCVSEADLSTLSLLLHKSIAMHQTEPTKFLIDNKLYLDDKVDILLDSINAEDISLTEYILENGFDINKNPLKYLNSATSMSENIEEMLNLLFKYIKNPELYVDDALMNSLKYGYLNAIIALGNMGYKLDNVFDYVLSYYYMYNADCLCTFIDLCDDEKQIEKLLYKCLKAKNKKPIKYAFDNNKAKLPLFKYLKYLFIE